MKIVLRTSGLLVLLVGLFVGFHFAAIETGEVAELTTRAVDGAGETTRLWIVEHDGRLWLNAGNDQAAWLARILAQPAVDVTFRGETRRYQAVTVPEARSVILPLMEQKYGWADHWVRGLVGRESVPVRLDPEPPQDHTTSGIRQQTGAAQATLRTWKPPSATTCATRPSVRSWWSPVSVASA